MRRFIFVVILLSFGCTAPAQEKLSEEIAEPHPKLGWRLLPNKKDVAWSKTNAGSPVYAVKVSTTEHGLRLTPQPLGPKNKYLVFFGDSNMFGEGLNDNETLPAQIADGLPDFAVYNFGMRGYGPGNFLAQTESLDIKSIVKESEGIAIYGHLSFHVARAFVRSDEISWSHRAPHIVGNDKKGIHTDGLFFEMRPWTTTFYQLYTASWVYKMTGRYFPSISPRDCDFICRVYRKAGENLKRQLPNTRFVVLIHPSGTGPLNNKIVTCLKTEGVETWVLDSLFKNVSASKVTIVGDGHISAVGNKVLASRILKNYFEREPASD